MQQLPIIWQRLVSDDGRTCDRCAATQGEVTRAVDTLQDVLRPLGIEPAVETREIDDATFRRDPSASNRIWVNGRPREDWLDATIGSSPCCSEFGGRGHRFESCIAHTEKPLLSGGFFAFGGRRLSRGRGQNGVNRWQPRFWWTPWPRLGG